jgi:hypothetical protein
MYGQIYGQMHGSIYGQMYGLIYGSIYGQMYGQICGSIYGQMYGQICGPHLNMHLYLFAHAARHANKTRRRRKERQLRASQTPAADCAATKTAKPSGVGRWHTAAVAYCRLRAPAADQCLKKISSHGHWSQARGLTPAGGTQTPSTEQR